MTVTILCIAVVGLFWGGYPLVVRAAGATSTIGILILTVAAVLPIGIMAWQSGQGALATHAIIKFIIAGTMMGIGLIAFNVAVTNPNIEISNVIPIINTMMLIVTTIGGIWFFSESITLQKMIGIALLVIGIILLRPTG